MPNSNTTVSETDAGPSKANIRREAVNCCDSLTDAAGDTLFHIRESKLIEMFHVLCSPSSPVEVEESGRADLRQAAVA